MFVKPRSWKKNTMDKRTETNKEYEFDANNKKKRQF